MDNTTQIETTPTMRAKRIPGARVYVYDVDTGREIGAYAFIGRGEYAIYQGKRYTDTVLRVDAIDLRTRCHVTITADRFPGKRIAVKEWLDSDTYSWSALIDRAKGWQGNEADGPTVERSEVGIVRMLRKVGVRC